MSKPVLITPPQPPSRKPCPAWTIEAHAMDGTTPMKVTRIPGQPLKLEGDIGFLLSILNELSFFTRNNPN